MTLQNKRLKNQRVEIDEYFMKIAYVVAERATCLRRKVGALVVKDKHILTTGYNGAPSGIKDCFEHGNCLRDILKIPSGKDKHICRGVHAEQNAIIQGAKFGVELRGGTVYCTHGSCVVCAKILINAGIKKFVSCTERKENDFEELFKEAGIEYVRIHKPSMAIESFDYKKDGCGCSG
jgi:dCMP deaminase